MRIIDHFDNADFDRAWDSLAALSDGIHGEAKGADAATIEACRWTPDADDQEQHLLATLHTPYDEAWETLIAFALEATP